MCCRNPNNRPPSNIAAGRTGLNSTGLGWDWDWETHTLGASSPSPPSTSGSHTLLLSLWMAVAINQSQQSIDFKSNHSFIYPATEPASQPTIPINPVLKSSSHSLGRSVGWSLLLQSSHFGTINHFAHRHPEYNKM